MNNSKYISFCGIMSTPDWKTQAELVVKFPLKFVEKYIGTDSANDEHWETVPTGYREGLMYETIGGSESMTLSLSIISEEIGHLVADCPDGGWVEETFVMLENGSPVKASEFNPNPIEQVI